MSCVEPRVRLPSKDAEPTLVSVELGELGDIKTRDALATNSSITTGCVSSQTLNDDSRREHTLDQVRIRTIPYLIDLHTNAPRGFVNYLPDSQTSLVAPFHEKLNAACAKARARRSCRDAADSDWGWSERLARPPADSHPRSPRIDYSMQTGTMSAAGGAGAPTD